MIRAVTFDCWNTLFRPFDPRSEARLDQLQGWLSGRGRILPRAVVRRHWEEAQHLSQESWRAGRQFGGAGIVEHLLRELLDNPGSDDQRRLQEVLSEPPGGLPPDLLPGVRELLPLLRSAGLRIGIVSDTALLTGRRIRMQLQLHGLLECFEPGALAFSDEVGVPKPNPAIFRRALDGLGVPAAEVAHVGDLKFTDVAGARALGMLSIRYTGGADDREQLPEADLVIAGYDQLPAALGI